MYCPYHHCIGLQGFTRKGLQSSVSGSLLIKSFNCIKEKTKLIVVLAQKRIHCGNLQDETEMHDSCGETPGVVGCSGKGRAAHLVRH